MGKVGEPKFGHNARGNIGTNPFGSKPLASVCFAALGAASLPRQVFAELRRVIRLPL